MTPFQHYATAISGTSATISTASTSFYLALDSTSCTGTSIWSDPSVTRAYESNVFLAALAHGARIPLGTAGRIELPDGAALQVDADGRWRIDDRDAKVVYRGNRFREFNRFINASDLIEEFIAFLGGLGVRQAGVLAVPIEVLINWLILRAAEQDGVDPPSGVRVKDHPRLLTDRRHRARCLVCARFIPRRHLDLQAPFCSARHMRARADLLPA